MSCSAPERKKRGFCEVSHLLLGKWLGIGLPVAFSVCHFALPVNTWRGAHWVGKGHNQEDSLLGFLSLFFHFSFTY